MRVARWRDNTRGNHRAIIRDGHADPGVGLFVVGLTRRGPGVVINGGDGVPVTRISRAAATAKDPVVIINADAKATHQSVIDVMQAAQRAGLSHVSFATQQAQR